MDLLQILERQNPTTETQCGRDCDPGKLINQHLMMTSYS